MVGPVTGVVGPLGPWEVILIAGVLAVALVSFLMWILRRERNQK